MFDTIDQILRQLSAGEDSRAEFKRVDIKGRTVRGPDRGNLAAGLVAFANAEGGTLFLGVDDSGTPTGIPRERLDLVEQWVVNIATDLCDPPIRPVSVRASSPTGSRSSRCRTAHSPAAGPVSFLSKMRSKRTGQVFLESRGEGVRKILEDGEAHSGRRPEYELFGNELRLTIWGKG